MNVAQIIQNEWESNPEVMNACLEIWKHLSNSKYFPEHYTFSELLFYSKSNDEKIVARSLLYLSNPKIQALNTCLMYEFDGGIFELPESEVMNYQQGKVVIHPEFGNELPTSEILVCFTPGRNLVLEMKE